MRLTAANVLGACAIALLMTGCGDSATRLSSPQSPAAPSAPAPSRPSFRLFGVVTETVNGQVVPVAGVVAEDVYWHISGLSGSDGAYSIKHEANGPVAVVFRKDGYLQNTQSVNLTEDTRLNVVLVRE